LLAVFLVTVTVLFVLTYCTYFAPNPPKEYQYGIKVAFPNLTFNRPVGIYNPRDNTNRLFALEQKGIIHVFENQENVSGTSVFLNMTDRVNSQGNEEGLLGMAFHPNFSQNRFFFLDYTASNPRRTVISRFTADRTNMNQADRNSETVLLEISQPYDNHNGGQITFGPDGFLYIAMGDGGSAGDPQGNGQSSFTLLGKILRIDVDSANPPLNYAIPSDNPFVGNTAGYRQEIYAFGLRNPWRFGFDFVSGWLWAGDVGQDRVEEVDVIRKGGNYGWNIMEGNLCYSSPQNCNQTGLEQPVWTYGRDQGYSVTGGFVYRGTQLAGLVGAYIYGDFGSGRIWSLRYDGVNEPVNSELLNTGLHISSFGLDDENELYFCAFDGKIYKITA